MSRHPIYTLLRASPDENEVSHLDEEAWQAIARVARWHRLEPLLYEQVVANGLDKLAPPSLLSRWKKDASEWLFLSLNRKSDLVATFTVLAHAGFSPVALKGAFLAFLAYREPHMRPMRDLDLLVSTKRKAIEATLCLLKNGYRQHNDTDGDVAAMLIHTHQAPPVIAPSQVTAIEIHARLSHADKDFDVSATPGFLDRTIIRDVLGQPIRFACPEDQLTHLILHGARDHRFNVGPGLLVDIAMLIGATEIDWMRFDALMVEADQVKTAQILLFLVARGWPELAIPDQPAPSPETLALVEELLCQDPAAIAEGRGRIDVNARSAWTSMRKLFPLPSYLAALFGKPANKLGYAKLYTRNIWRIARWRIPRLTSAKGRSTARLLEQFDDIVAKGR